MGLFSLTEFERFLQLSNSFSDIDQEFSTTFPTLEVVKEDSPIYDFCTLFTIGSKQFNFIAYIEEGNIWKISFHNENEYNNIKNLTKEQLFEYYYGFLTSLRMLLKEKKVKEIQFIFFNKMNCIERLLNNTQVFKFIMIDSGYKYSRNINRGSINQISYTKTN
jgi:hypothetical protein